MDYLRPLGSPLPRGTGLLQAEGQGSRSPCQRQTRLAVGHAWVSSGAGLARVPRETQASSWMAVAPRALTGEA